MKAIQNEGDFTRLMNQAREGDPHAEQQFWELVNDELRRVAAGMVRRRGNQLDAPTSMVNELYLRLFHQGFEAELHNRSYFFAVAIDQMRQILRHRFRQRNSQRKGGHLERVPLEIVLDDYLDNFQSTNTFDFEALDNALERMKNSKLTSRQYEIIHLRFFAGLTVEETAQFLQVSARTVSGDWKLARARLSLELDKDS